MLPRYMKQPWLREGRYCELHEQHLLRYTHAQRCVCACLSDFAVQGARKIAQKSYLERSRRTVTPYKKEQGGSPTSRSAVHRMHTHTTHSN